jgi:hypothetical protein
MAELSLDLLLYLYLAELSLMELLDLSTLSLHMGDSELSLYQVELSLGLKLVYPLYQVELFLHLVKLPTDLMELSM